MSEATKKPKAYRGVECGNCGDPIEPGDWCGNDDCMLGNRDPTPTDTSAEDKMNST